MLFYSLLMTSTFFFSTGKEVEEVANGAVRVTSNDMPPTESAACYGRSQWKSWSELVSGSRGRRLSVSSSWNDIFSQGQQLELKLVS